MASSELAAGGDEGGNSVAWSSNGSQAGSVKEARTKTGGVLLARRIEIATVLPLSSAMIGGSWFRKYRERRRSEGSVMLL